MVKFIWILFLSIQVSGFEISQNTEIEGNVVYIEFDSKFNSYIATRSSTDYGFYKLDPNNNIIFKKNFTRIYDLLLNSNQDIYILARGSTVDTIWILKSHSNNLEPVFQYTSKEYIIAPAFMDEEDNILINTKNGIEILKPDQNIPIAIENLQSYNFRIYSTTNDRQGNIYLARISNTPNVNPEIVVITSAAKQQPVPYATVVEDVIENDYKINQLTTDSNNNVIFSESLEQSNGKIKLIKDGSVNLVMSQLNFLYSGFHVTKHRTFFIAYDYSSEGTSCYVYYIDANMKVSKIDKVFDYPFYAFQEAQALGTSDRYGNMFFVNNNNYNFTEILWVRNNETQAQEFFKTIHPISKIYADNSDVLWVICDIVDGYRQYIQIPIYTGTYTSFSGQAMANIEVLIENTKTGEILIGSKDGLFVLTP